ncbi:unnamed protein product [Lota lota]
MHPDVTPAGVHPRIRPRRACMHTANRRALPRSTSAHGGTPQTVARQQVVTADTERSDLVPRPQPSVRPSIHVPKDLYLGDTAPPQYSVRTRVERKHGECSTSDDKA